MSKLDESLRKESQELARILTDLDISSLERVQEFAGYVGRLAVLMDSLVERLDDMESSPGLIKDRTVTQGGPTEGDTPAPVTTFAGKRALVVDDDLASRRLATRLLNRQGFTCSAAASVIEARTLLENGRYSLLVTDMRMWGEEGLDLVRFATDEYPEMAAIMVSGMDEAGLADRAVQAGASAYLRKPFDIEEFADQVAAALEERAEMIKLRKHREGR